MQGRWGQFLLMASHLAESAMQQGLLGLRENRRNLQICWNVSAPAGMGGDKNEGKRAAVQAFGSSFFLYPLHPASCSRL